MNTAASNPYVRDTPPEGTRGKQEPTSLTEIGTQLGELVDTVAESLVGLNSSLRSQLQTRPYVTLAAAAGVGYVLGGGLPTRLTRLLLGMGTRIAIPVLVNQFTALVSQGNASTTQTLRTR